MAVRVNVCIKGWTCMLQHYKLWSIVIDFLGQYFMSVIIKLTEWSIWNSNTCSYIALYVL